MTPQAKLRRVGWIALLAILTGLYLMLHLRVQALHSEVVRTEWRIVALEQEKLLLATEFETRANQMQLAAWNQVDFGYVAPTAGQFLDQERHLASLGAGAVIPDGSAVMLANAEEEQGLVQLAVAPDDDSMDRRMLASVGDGDTGEVRLAAATVTTARVPLVALTGAAAE